MSHLIAQPQGQCYSAFSDAHFTGRFGLPSMKTELLQRITIEPGKCGGRPCIRGMRIRVQDILDMLAAGTSQEEILHDYPYLERDDIRAAMTYAAAYLNHTIVPAQTR
jgi:uncharacterized protein (DUF433 family)